MYEQGIVRVMGAGKSSPESYIAERILWLCSTELPVLLPQRTVTTKVLPTYRTTRYYAEAVKWAKSLGIASGRRNGISRADGQHDP